MELVVLLVSIIIILVILYYYNNNNNINKHTETFQNYHLSSCPSGYKSFYDNNGDNICCDGDIVANRCIGDRQCTLTGSGIPGMPNCVVAVLEEYAKKGKDQCPSTMPTYFEDKSRNIKACTLGDLNDTLTGLKNYKQSTCVIYPTWDLNKNTKDSCFNQKQLANAKCFGNNCNTEIVQPIPNNPVLVAIGFTDTTGMHRVAYTRQSTENFLDTINPNWRNQGMDLSKNINVAEVAKAYYVDRTVEQADVQF